MRRGMGSYEPLDAGGPDERLARGKIDVALQGVKLRGGFTLIRIGNRAADPSQKERWLLTEHRDGHADPSWNIESCRFDYSVLTGRSLKEIEIGSPSKKRRRGSRPRLTPRLTVGWGLA